jgi:hypothetical protein
MLNTSEVKSRKRGIKTIGEVEFYWEASLIDPFGSRRRWKENITTDLNEVVVEHKLWTEHIFLGVAGIVFLNISIVTVDRFVNFCSVYYDNR